MRPAEIFGQSDFTAVLNCHGRWTELSPGEFSTALSFNLMFGCRQAGHGLGMSAASSWHLIWKPW